MVVLMVVVTAVVFLLVDLLARWMIRRVTVGKERRLREKALDIGLRLDYSEEAPSLKRIDVENPRARILAVDDESIVLDSFRKILVLAGFSIDTVETGREAIGLVRKHDYDFVFTDLKMPEMDGLDVTKAVKHMRPDTDVIMITGYATIESAVDAMKFGALDYVQKPFTADELVAFANQSLIRRHDRQERQRKPRVHLVTPSSGESRRRHTFNVASGLFISDAHEWVCLCRDGMLIVGLDDFALKVFGDIDHISVPTAGTAIKKGDPLVEVSHGANRVIFPSPISGKVMLVNERVLDEPETVSRSPYDRGWLCGIEPTSLADDIKILRIGADAVNWYQSETDRYVKMIDRLDEEEPVHQGDRETAARHEERRWKALSEAFVRT